MPPPPARDDSSDPSASAHVRAARGEGARLRDALVAAGARLVEENDDIGAVTVRRIVETTGVSQGAFYLHFQSRDEFLYELAYRALGASEERLGRELAQEPDPIRRIQLRGDSYVEFALNNPHYYRVLFMGTGAEANADRFEGVDDFSATGLGPLAADVREAMAAGLIEDDDPTVLASILWMTEHGFCSLLLSVPGFPWPSVRSLRSRLDLFTAAGIRAVRPD